jgi:CheY-like chemotaxis protein
MVNVPPVEKRYRICVVDDSAADIILLRHALEKNKISCDVEIAEDGGRAIERLDCLADGHGPAPDLFILDINLPRENGLEVLTRLRSIPSLADIPVVVLTSSDSPEERQRAEALDVLGFFNKPTELQDFVLFGARLKQILQAQICGKRRQLPGRGRVGGLGSVCHRL